MDYVIYAAVGLLLVGYAHQILVNKELRRRHNELDAYDTTRMKDLKAVNLVLTDHGASLAFLRLGYNALTAAADTKTTAAVGARTDRALLAQLEAAVFGVPEQREKGETVRVGGLRQFAEEMDETLKSLEKHFAALTLRTNTACEGASVAQAGVLNLTSQVEFTKEIATQVSRLLCELAKAGDQAKKDNPYDVTISLEKP